MLRRIQVFRFSSKSGCSKPHPEKIISDMIGPVDSVSNLRPIVCKQHPNESSLEKEFREEKLRVQEWNHKFWHDHNSRFLKEREEYLKKNLPVGEQTLTAEEMSVFYKLFLDKNWKMHVTYNLQWYKNNFNLLKLAIKIEMSKWYK